LESRIANQLAIVKNHVIMFFLSQSFGLEKTIAKNWFGQRIRCTNPNAVKHKRSGGSQRPMEGEFFVSTIPSKDQLERRQQK
jgi:hypothetical protein